jgi:hypothetical protein
MHIEYMDGSRDNVFIMSEDEPLIFLSFQPGQYVLEIPADSYLSAVKQVERLAQGAEFLQPMWRNGLSSFSASGTREQLARLALARELRSRPSWQTIVREVTEGASHGFISVYIAGHKNRSFIGVTISSSGLVLEDKIEFALASNKWSVDELTAHIENSTSDPQILAAFQLAVSQCGEQIARYEVAPLLVRDPMMQPGYEFYHDGTLFRWNEHPNMDPNSQNDRGTTKIIRWSAGAKNPSAFESIADDLDIVIESFQVNGFLADRNQFPYNTPTVLYLERSRRYAELRTTQLTDIQIMELVQASSTRVMKDVVPALVQNGIEHYGRSLPFIPILDDTGIANLTDFIVTEDPNKHSASANFAIDPRVLEPDSEIIQMTQFEL